MWRNTKLPRKCETFQRFFRFWRRPVSSHLRCIQTTSTNPQTRLFVCLFFFPLSTHLQSATAAMSEVDSSPKARPVRLPPPVMSRGALPPPDDGSPSAAPIRTITTRRDGQQQQQHDGGRVLIVNKKNDDILGRLSELERVQSQQQTQLSYAAANANCAAGLQTQITQQQTEIANLQTSILDMMMVAPLNDQLAP